MEFNFSMNDVSDIEVPNNGSLYVAVTDNVTDEEDWSVSELSIVGGMVQNSEPVQEGIYDAPELVGMTINDLQEWLDFDPTGHHPEIHHQIVLPIG